MVYLSVMYVQITENGQKPTLSKYLFFGFLFTPALGDSKRLGAFPVSQQWGGRADPVSAPLPLTAKLYSLSCWLAASGVGCGRLFRGSTANFDIIIGGRPRPKNSRSRSPLINKLTYDIYTPLQVIHLPDTSYEAFELFVKILYSEPLNLNTISLNLLDQLYHLAEKYLVFEMQASIVEAAK